MRIKSGNIDSNGVYTVKKYRDSVMYNESMMKLNRMGSLINARDIFRDNIFHDCIEGQLKGIRAGEETTIQLQSELIRVDFKMKYIIDRTMYFNNRDAA